MFVDSCYARVGLLRRPTSRTAWCRRITWFLCASAPLRGTWQLKQTNP